MIERVSASRKLGEPEARQLAGQADLILVAKGKRVLRFERPSERDADLIEAMLGPTQNLRAPTMRVGRRIVVGFHADAYAEVLSDS